MAIPTSPSLPSSFDPAIHLHSEIHEPDIADTRPHSDIFSDEVEAYDLQRLETRRELTKKRVVIQHRTWHLSDVFRSDDDCQPGKSQGNCCISTILVASTLNPVIDTPCKRRQNRYAFHGFDNVLDPSPDLGNMASVSSPRLSFHDTNPIHNEGNVKRKIQDDSSSQFPKRARMLGPFVMDEDDEEEDSNPFLYQDAEISTPTNHLHIVSHSKDTATNIEEVSPFQEQNTSPAQPIRATSDPSINIKETYSLRSCSGKVLSVGKRSTSAPISYERMIAGRSVAAPGRAQKSYYGVDIHRLLDEAAEDKLRTSNSHTRSEIKTTIETPGVSRHSPKSNTMWSEKYRARRFKDLVGDDRTHLSVLRWLKAWDSVVFPGLAKAKQKAQPQNDTEDQRHRKVLLLAGPPGLGKTTLAHVCAKQAGYEALEINASDERSRDVVKGRIRDAVGTENVKGISARAGDKGAQKSPKPICVIVDEVDGVVTGSSGGGEGGFMKALIDLLMLDEKNSGNPKASTEKRKRKGDNFRLLRPMILICNDVYHASLRPLRTSSLVQIIHVRHPPLEKIVHRMRSVFENEGIPCDGDGIRRLCEASWGLSSDRDRRTNNRGVGEGDIRSVLVSAEWIANRLRGTSLDSNYRLTRKWVEQHVANSSANGSSLRGLGRGGTREIVERVFVDGAGFSDTPTSSKPFGDQWLQHSNEKPAGIPDFRKHLAMSRLTEMIEAAGDHDRCVTDCFITYPTKSYQDDTLLSKPNAAYDWLYFHDLLSSKVYTNQDWELNPYLSQSIAAFHHLFASSNRQHKDYEKDTTDDEEHPFSGPWSDFAAFEAEKHNRSVLTEFQSSFPAPVLRYFRSTETIVTELIPNILTMLSPDIKPVVVGGSEGRTAIASVRKESERALVRAAVGVMSGLGVTFENARIESEGWTPSGRIYRMEP